MYSITSRYSFEIISVYYDKIARVKGKQQFPMGLVGTMGKQLGLTHASNIYTRDGLFILLSYILFLQRIWRINDKLHLKKERISHPNFGIVNGIIQFYPLYSITFVWFISAI